MSILQRKRKVFPRMQKAGNGRTGYPLLDIYEDGICLVGRNLYSKPIGLPTSIMRRHQERIKRMFLAYSQILNSF